jgi:hypothetical protein
MSFEETNVVYPENQLKPVHTFYKGSAELLNVKEDGILSYRFFKG